MSVVHSFQPAIDDWFVVQNIEKDRWIIERVVAWALVPGSEHRIWTLGAFRDRGYIVEDDGADAYFVKGTDKSQIGTRWTEIYDQTPLNSAFVREIEGPLKETLRRQ